MITLTQTAILLAAAVVAVSLVRFARLSSILGYLVAGLVIGPWGLNLISDVNHIMQVAEFGIVLLLFVIGLELQPTRLWVMRRIVFGLGAAQVALCTLLLITYEAVSRTVSNAAAVNTSLTCTRATRRSAGRSTRRPPPASTPSRSACSRSC